MKVHNNHNHNLVGKQQGDGIVTTATTTPENNKRIPGTALHTAIFNSMDKTIQYDEYYIQVLLENGADPNRIKDGLTPLACATMFGHDTLVTLLLEHGADPNIVVQQQQQQQEQHHHDDTSSSSATTTTLLLRDGMTPLHWTGPWGRPTIASILLQHGADRTITMNHGWTPLHCATLACADDVVKVLTTTTTDNNKNDNTTTTTTSIQLYDFVVNNLNDDGESAITIARGKGDVARRNIYRHLLRIRLANKSNELKAMMMDGL